MSSLQEYAENQSRSHLNFGPSVERLAQLTIKIGQMADGNIRAAHLLGPAVACRAGCSHCCRHMFVTTVIPEVLNLAQTIQSTYTAERRAALDQRIEAYWEIAQAVPAPTRAAGVQRPCPLLENDLCGAFEARPLACRRHNSIDVEACIQYKEGTRRVPPLANSEQTRIGNELLSGLAIGLRR